MGSKSRMAVLITVLLFLAAVPSLAWGNLYMVGGDDTRLYYVFPREMIAGYARNLATMNSLGVNTGYGSVSFLIPMLLIIALLKSAVPFLQPQMLLYGLNLAIGFLFMYRFIGLWADEDGDSALVSKTVASVTYVLSPFLIKTVYHHQLIAIYSVSVLPVTLYYLCRGILERRMRDVAFAAVAYSMFSSTLLTLPWFGAVAVTLLPFGLLVFLKNPKWTVFYVVVFGLLVVGLNTYWLAHLLYPMVVKSGSGDLVSSLTSQDIKRGNTQLIETLSHLNNPINQMVGYLRSSWSDRQNIHFSQSFGILYTLVIGVSAIFLRTRKQIVLYVVAVSALVLAMLLVTPSFGGWNVSLFLFLNNTVPFFTMFRNMYDKFAMAMAFQVSLALAIALIILSERMRKLPFYGLVAAIAAVTVFNARSFIVPSGQLEDTERISGTFNRDYIDLINYVRTMHESSRYLWLPMNFASYVVIEDGIYSGHYYVGSSPLQFLAGSSDYTGFQSFATVADPMRNNQLRQLLTEGKYAEMAAIFQQMNVKYVILDHDRIPVTEGSNLNVEGAIDAQSEAFIRFMLGPKIRDFGQRYSLYRVNGMYSSETVFLTSSPDASIGNRTDIPYRRIDDTSFDVSAPALKGNIQLVLLTPYHTGWGVYVVGKEGRPVGKLALNDTMAYQYGNAWTLSAESIGRIFPDAVGRNADDSISVKLRLVFEPSRVTVPAAVVAAIIWTGTAIYILGATLKNGSKSDWRLK